MTMKKENRIIFANGKKRNYLKVGKGGYIILGEDVDKRLKNEKRHGILNKWMKL